jgi:hypothetical protein
MTAIYKDGKTIQVFDRVWYWKPRLPGEKNRKGLRCRVLIRGKRNSASTRESLGS